MVKSVYISLIYCVISTLLIEGSVSQIYKTYQEQDPDDLPDDKDYGLEGYDGGDYGGYGGEDYWINVPENPIWKIEPEPVVLEPVVLVLECYTCTYTKMEYHEHGMPNCDDPFRDSGIPVLVCEGLCAKSKSMLGKDEYMMTRSCMPNCQTIYDDVNTVECCYGNRCNGARNAAVINVAMSWCVLSLALLAAISK